MTLKEHNVHHHQTNAFIHANEIGFWGIGCTAMKQLYDFICNANPNFNIGYYDVKHNEDISKKNTALHFQNVELQLKQVVSQFQINQFFNAADLVIVNGNHHQAKSMILILDGKKEFRHNAEHIIKTSVLFYNEQTEALANELIEANPTVKIVSGTDLESINLYLQSIMKQQVPSLIGLVLAGGESKRMEQNKSLIAYHGKPHWIHLFHLLEKKCESCYISTSVKNAYLYESKPVIIDTLSGYGPISGIISALLKNKNNAILVVACDLPLLDEETLDQLLNERDASKMGTTFLNPDSNYLEPLITIYEPKALQIMLSMLAQGYTCPRKMLMQNDVKILKPKNSSALKNINYPQEKEEIMETLRKKNSL
jgi:molybdopterin-guanine dinucleotide biosynthesis protein A